MRGADEQPGSMFSYVSLEERVPQDHPLRAIRRIVLIHADTERLLSNEHFTVDGTLLEAWASHNSFRRRDDEPPSDAGGKPTSNVHGDRRTNDTG